MTFNLSGKYLFQYNIYVMETVTNVSIFGLINGVPNTSIGVQNIGNEGSYGCSVIQDMAVNDSISLKITDGSWTFASLTIIKL